MEAGETRIYLVRHGQTLANVAGVVQGQAESELSSLGWKQARQLARRFQPVHLDVAITSDLRRATATASRILEHHNTALRVEPLLREQHWGVYQRRPIGEVVPGGQREAELLIDPPGGESMAELAARAEAFWTSYGPQIDGRAALIVSHGILLAMLLRVILGEPVPGEPAEALGNASVTMLQRHGALRFRVAVHNDMSHWAGESPG